VTICASVLLNVPTVKSVFTALILAAAALTNPVFAQTKSEPPVPVRTVPPDYPNELRREGVSGLVMVKCSIDEQGNVIETEIEKSSNVAFEKPAVAALKKWKFKPAKQDGTPVAIKVSIPIKFVFES
jgi:protein TonB